MIDIVEGEGGREEERRGGKDNGKLEGKRNVK